MWRLPLVCQVKSLEGDELLSQTYDEVHPVDTLSGLTICQGEFSFFPLAIMLISPPCTSNKAGRRVRVKRSRRRDGTPVSSSRSSSGIQTIHPCSSHIVRTPAVELNEESCADQMQLLSIGLTPRKAIGALPDLQSSESFSHHHGMTEGGRWWKMMRSTFRPMFESTEIPQGCCGIIS